VGQLDHRVQAEELLPWRVHRPRVTGLDHGLVFRSDGGRGAIQPCELGAHQVGLWNLGGQLPGVSPQQRDVHGGARSQLLDAAQHGVGQFIGSVGIRGQGLAADRDQLDRPILVARPPPGDRRAANGVRVGRRVRPGVRVGLRAFVSLRRGSTAAPGEVVLQLADEGDQRLAERPVGLDLAGVLPVGERALEDRCRGLREELVQRLSDLEVLLGRDSGVALAHGRLVLGEQASGLVGHGRHALPRVAFPQRLQKRDRGGRAARRGRIGDVGPPCLGRHVVQTGAVERHGAQREPQIRRARQVEADQGVVPAGRRQVDVGLDHGPAGLVGLDRDHADPRMGESVAVLHQP